MKTLLTIALLIATTAHAGGKPHGNVPVSADSSANAAAGAVSGSTSAAQSDASAFGGTANAAGGSAVAEGAETNIGISEEHEAPAPAIAVIPPVSTMDCIRGFGVGGSNQNGALVLGPTWRDRDCVAAKQFETLATLKMPIPAAKAYCSRPRHVEPFGTQEECESSIAQAIIDANMPEERVVYWPQDTECRESLKRCEATVTK